MKRAAINAVRRTLRIGELSKASRLTPDTLRYYERLGLLAPAQRTSGGFRAYEPGTLERVRFIKTAQAHGLSLREIRELVGHQTSSRRDRCRRVRDLLSRRLSELEQKRGELEAFCAALRHHLEMCERALASAGDTRCPVVEDLVSEAARVGAS
ncbi:MAG: MerR family transcriptional regulator [Vicinamibacterales bacterium]